MKRAIYAVDIGSTRCKPGCGPNFAWARVDPENPSLVSTSTSIDALAVRLISDLNEDCSIALGFEAPLFIPVPEESAALCYGRKNEGSRSFAAPAGLSVTALGVHEAAWVLRRIAQSCDETVQFATNPASWPPTGNSPILFCWEAFVSDRAHSESHLRDAATAVMAFLSAERNLQAATKIAADNPLSLIGAVALWSGLTEDKAVLHGSTVVIRPEVPFEGPL